MKSIAWIFLLSVLSFTSRAQLSIDINYNVELLGLAYFIGFEGVDIEKKTITIEGREIPKKEWHSYGYRIYQQYKKYAASENLAKSFTV
ncbi:MAG TPA: hypothetical protein VD996_15830, partial [Chitinophagaceae bacterium]|nr:hypothetical protein [Chitinophagaceae bacterium]